MDSVEKKYKVHRRFNLDFEIVVQGRNEEEAAYSAGSIELDRWNQVDSSWELFQDGHIRRIIERRDQGKPGQVVYLIDSDGDGIFETTIPAAR